MNHKVWKRIKKLEEEVEGLRFDLKVARTDIRILEDARKILYRHRDRIDALLPPETNDPRS